VPSRSVRTKGRSSRNSEAAERSNALVLALGRLGWGPRDAVGFVVCSFAAVAILTNMLFLQSGSHPAPMFKSVVLAPEPPRTVVALPRARPPEATPAVAPAPTLASAPARSSADIVSDIQRELGRRGFYDGVVDGRYGPKTDAAVRDFEQAAGLKPSTEPNEALAAAITRSSLKSAKATTASTSGRGNSSTVRPDAPVDKASGSKRVVAVQRALAEYGYGQIKPSGVIDAETKAAIEKFERERKLPITGQVSDRVARELAALTGRPLE
jgi:peptidoglycan hydrolase-like protein with peptidoglycan-binding domain